MSDGALPGPPQPSTAAKRPVEVMKVYPGQYASGHHGVAGQVDTAGGRVIPIVPETQVLRERIIRLILDTKQSHGGICGSVTHAADQQNQQNTPATMQVVCHVPHLTSFLFAQGLRTNQRRQHRSFAGPALQGIVENDTYAPGMT